MSGACRAVPGSELCQDGLAMKVLVPPPEPPIFPSASGGSNSSFKANERMLALVPQPTSAVPPVPVGMPMLVPPIEVDQAEDAG